MSNQSQSNELLARVLRSGSRTFGAYASGELLEAHAEAGAGWGPDPFAAWQNCLALRVEELAAAVAAEQPRLFTSQVGWAKAVLVAREVSAEHFQHCASPATQKSPKRAFQSHDSRDHS